MDYIYLSINRSTNYGSEQYKPGLNNNTAENINYALFCQIVNTRQRYRVHYLTRKEAY